jgi:cytochrome c oxidase accessory protein FixG
MTVKFTFETASIYIKIMETNGEHSKDSFRDSVSTINEFGKRVWIYAQKPFGKFYKARSILSVIYLVLFFTIPFIKVDGEPLFLINILERKFIIFGVVFWSQDLFLFGFGMITFIVFIVLFTVVFGRIFCGWICPQTIFLEMVFRQIEYWIEGDASHQKTLNKQPWNTEKITKKGLKVIVFFIVSFIIANTFLAYIIGVDELQKLISEPISKSKGTLTSLLIFTGAFFFVYSWFREQVCIIACPYGRLQGVLLDKNSIIVAYDYVRGEPRGKFSKKREDSKGDCIDCYQCVKVCPTGIDIRNGTQLECVNCTACIDVCDHMMESVGYEKGLIRYASEKGIADNQPLRLTPRIVGYSAVLLVLIGILITLLASRTDLETSILRTPGMLYHKQGEDKISNLYNIKLVNKTRNDMDVTLKLQGDLGSIKMVGKDTIHLKKEDLASSAFFVVLDKEKIKDRKTKLVVDVYSSNKKIESVTTTFLGPISRTIKK